MRIVAAPLPWFFSGGSTLKPASRRILVAFSRDVVLVDAVMRQMDDDVLIAARAQPIHVKRQHLANRLVIIDYADLLPHPLHNPDRESVGQGTGAADVDEGAQRQQGIGSDLADPSLLPRLGK
jgi:hypothetical protein